MTAGMTRDSTVGYGCEAEIVDEVGLDGGKVLVCKGVYPPAEDTWLLLNAAVGYANRLRPRLVIDVGSGTGAVYIGVGLSRVVYGVLIDVSPCAAVCSLLNVKRLNLLADVVQCDNASCIRVPRGSLVVYNTPYLPSSDEMPESLWWQGGAREAVKLVRLLRGYCGWLGLVTIANTSPASELLDVARSSGIEARIVAEKPEDFFTRVYVVELRPRQCA